MNINLALSGANGRMGKEIIHTVSKDSVFNLIIQLTRNNSTEYLNKFLNTIYLDSVSEVNDINNINLNKIDVLIDFSTPASCLEYADICNQYKIPMVIGTTGFNDYQKKQLIDLAKSSPILLSPNMSLGVNICKYLIGSFSRLWSKYYNENDGISINIKEVHHKHKKDTPSGTALSIANVINRNFATITGKKAYQEKVPINFISKRLGEVKGMHQVTFSNIFEEISIKHGVKDRSIFAQGALLAAKWLVNKYKVNRSNNQIYELYDFFHVIDLDLDFNFK